MSKINKNKDMQIKIQLQPFEINLPSITKQIKK